MSCATCDSFAINHGLHGRDGADDDLCDVCYWRKRTKAAVERIKEMNEQIVELQLTLARYKEREKTMGWNQS